MKKFFISIAFALLLVIVITGMGLAALARTEASGSFVPAQRRNESRARK